MFPRVVGRSLFALGIVLSLFIPAQSGAQEIPSILGLEKQGELMFTEVSNATSYAIQWQAAPGGSWTNFAAAAASLDAIAPSGSGIVTVDVPVAFRVLASISVPSVTSALYRLEAESYDAMSGIQMEPGNNAIGWYDAGDWIRFDDVDFGSGVNSVIFSVAKDSVGGTVELRVDGVAGDLIGVFTPQSTGGWAVYMEQEANIPGTNGVHDLYLVGAGATGVCNIDWFRFSTNTVYEPNYALVWSDEFSGSTLNSANWYPVQHGDVDNGELQFYTDRPDNVSVSNGYLWLTAIQETYVGTGPWMSGVKTSEYTSGQIESFGKVAYQYGKFEASMKLPRGEGTWPAFWLLGNNIFDSGVGWPLCGELDIMEHANVLDNIGAAVHTEAYNHAIGTQKTGGYGISDYDTAFHVYGMEWTSEQISFSVDSNTFFTVTKAEMGTTQAQWPFDQPFWMKFNLAVGGAWGGDPSGGTYPYQMQVDWVRIYQDQGP